MQVSHEYFTILQNTTMVRSNFIILVEVVKASRDLQDTCNRSSVWPTTGPDDPKTCSTGTSQPPVRVHTTKIKDSCEAEAAQMWSVGNTKGAFLHTGSKVEP